LPRLRLLTAGPVDVDDDVLAALAEPTLPHYGPPWRPIYESTLDYAAKLFQTKNDILLMPGPGSGALDTGIGSLIPPGSSICVPRNGFFGERVQAIVEAYDIHAHVIEFEAGKPIDPELLRQKLAIWIPESEAWGRPMHAIAVVHHETSTGVLNPLAEIAQVAKEFDIVLIVDAVASLGGVPVPVDELGIDICVTVPNKCLGAPPGVAMMSVSERAWKLAENNPARHGWYHDLRTWAWFREHEKDWHPYPTTLPTNVIVALNRALQRIFEEGIETHHASIRNAAIHTREGMDEFGFKMLPDPEYAAPMLSAFYACPDMGSVSEFMRYLRDEHGLMVSGGLGDLTGKIFRVGHMGEASSPEVVSALLDGVGEYLKSKGLNGHH
jgi:alanine-glyoxylate transaminase/serine-glyoxylate transaminase/serine-pyruvate transaminase